jgi:hypothetical protein
MKFINLTPHTITIYDLHAEKTTLPSSGVARVETTEKTLEPINDIPIVSSPVQGPVIGLPEPSDGISYVVSSVVLNHPSVRGRKDVFGPGTGPKHAPLRDGENRIVGVTRLVAAPLKD